MLKRLFLLGALAAAATPAVPAAAAATAAPTTAAPTKHSLSEYAYLIGTWDCDARPTARSPFKYSTTFAWKYPNKSVIDQSIVFPRGSANFMLAYDAKSNSFHGTYVDSNGAIGVWTNPGPENGQWWEVGYSYRGNATLAPESRTHFFGVTDTHYAYKYWTIKSRTDAGKLADVEDCVKRT